MRITNGIYALVLVFFALGFVEQHKQRILSDYKVFYITGRYKELAKTHSEQKKKDVAGSKENFDRISSQLDRYKRDTLYHNHWVARPEVRIATRYLIETGKVKP